MPECSLLISVLLTLSCVSEFRNDFLKVSFFFFFFFTVSHSMWGLSSPTRDWTHNPYIGSTVSQPLGHQGSPNVSFLDHQNNVAIQSHSIITLHFYFLHNSCITYFLLYYLCLFICLIVYVKEMATNCSILAWKILWTEEPVRLQSKDCKEQDTAEQLSTSICCIFLHTPSLGHRARAQETDVGCLWNEYKACNY